MSLHYMDGAIARVMPLAEAASSLGETKSQS
jgi:hypothetical protein